MGVAPKTTTFEHIYSLGVYGVQCAAVSSIPRASGLMILRTSAAITTDNEGDVKRMNYVTP